MQLVLFILDMIETTHTESLIEKHDTPATELNAKADFRNICLLLVLYTLQGVPLGLSLAIPIFIQNTKNTTFKEQVSALFDGQFKIFKL